MQVAGNTCCLRSTLADKGLTGSRDTKETGEWIYSVTKVFFFGDKVRYESCLYRKRYDCLKYHDAITCITLRSLRIDLNMYIFQGISHAAM